MTAGEAVVLRDGSWAATLAVVLLYSCVPSARNQAGLPRYLRTCLVVYQGI